MIRTTTDLRDWRAAKGWSQQEAADALGYKLRGYIELERRKDGTIPSRVGLTIMGSDIASRTVARSLHGLTNGDLSDEDNIRQADHELKRATTDAQLADWARRWGECAVKRLHKMSDIDEADVTALAAAEQELTALENKHTLVTDAAERLIKVLDGIPDHSNTLDKAIADLENAL